MASTLLFAALLGVVQGLTEFLPVSSSAHLILARAFFGWDAEAFGMPFDVACHVGTLLAVLVYFRREILEMIQALPGVFASAPTPAARLIRLIVIGTIPAVAAGLVLKNLEDQLRTPLVAAVTLALVALVFFVVERYGAKRRDEASLGLGDAVIIGCAQAFALVPGVSRSGSTISAAMALGMKRDSAARFTFLLGVPAILGAALVEGRHLLEAGLRSSDVPVFAIGIVSSAIVGYLAVAFFIRFLGSHSLRVFAWYRLALAAAVVVWWVR